MTDMNLCVECETPLLNCEHVEDYALCDTCQVKKHQLDCFYPLLTACKLALDTLPSIATIDTIGGVPYHQTIMALKEAVAKYEGHW